MDLSPGSSDAPEFLIRKSRAGVNNLDDFLLVAEW